MHITYTSDSDSLNFWLIYHWQSTDIPPTINGQRIGRVPAAISTNMSTVTRPISRWIHRLTYLRRSIGQESVEMSTNIPVDTRPICQSIHQSSVGRYVNQHTGRHSADMSTDTSVECWSICRSIYRSRGAQNTHDSVTELLIEKTWGRGCVIFGEQKDKRAKWWNSFENGLRPRWITPSCRIVHIVLSGSYSSWPLPQWRN